MASNLGRIKAITDSLTFWTEEARGNVFALVEELLRDDDNDRDATTVELEHQTAGEPGLTRRDIFLGYLFLFGVGASFFVLDYAGALIDRLL
jgi:hypothetical protein